MKKIGFLSFGHWADHPSCQARTVSDTLVQSIDLASCRRCRITVEENTF